MRQRLLTIREYTEEFYRINIRVGYTEDTSEKVARYMNGLKFDIQDEMSLFSPKSVEEAYQCALKVEEKLNRRNNSGRGRGQTYRGKGSQTGRGKSSVQKGEAESSSQPEQPQRGRHFRGRRSFQRGRGRDRNYEVRCYTYGNIGHMSWDCPKGVARQGNIQVAQVEIEQRVPENHVEIPKVGEALLMRKTLLKPSKEVHEPA